MVCGCGGEEGDCEAGDGAVIGACEVAVECGEEGWDRVFGLGGSLSDVGIRGRGNRRGGLARK